MFSKELIRQKNCALSFAARNFSMKPSGPRRGEIVLLSQRKLNFADVLIVP